MQAKIRFLHIYFIFRLALKMLVAYHRFMNEIFKLRKSVGLSQKDLAKKLDIDQGTISRWERDEVPVKAMYLIAVRQIVAELGVK